MSGDCIKAWRETVTREQLEQAQNSMPVKRRPALQTLENVGGYLAQSFIETRGYVEETQLQIATALHGVLTTHQISDALVALDNVGLWVVIRKGAPGHATRRVMATHDPKNLANRNGVNPDTMNDERNGIDTATQRGKDHTQRGSNETQRANPVTPEQLPEHNLNPHLEPVREQVADKVAEIALQLDQVRAGKIRTQRLLRERRSKYRAAAMQYLNNESDATQVDPDQLALHLVDPKAAAIKARKSVEPAPWELSSLSCEVCNGAGMYMQWNDAENRSDNKLCACVDMQNA